MAEGKSFAFIELLVRSLRHRAERVPASYVSPNRQRDFAQFSLVHSILVRIGFVIPVCLLSFKTGQRTN